MFVVLLMQERIEDELKRSTTETGDSSTVDEFALMERALGQRRGHIRGVGRVVRHPTPVIASAYPPPPQQWNQQEWHEMRAFYQQQQQEREQQQQREAERDREVEELRRQMEEMRRMYERGRGGN
jgi:hypothetical protein